MVGKAAEKEWYYGESISTPPGQEKMPPDTVIYKDSTLAKYMNLDPCAW